MFGEQGTETGPLCLEDIGKGKGKGKSCLLREVMALVAFLSRAHCASVLLERGVLYDSDAQEDGCPFFRQRIVGMPAVVVVLFSQDAVYGFYVKQALSETYYVTRCEAVSFVVSETSGEQSIDVSSSASAAVTVTEECIYYTVEDRTQAIDMAIVPLSGNPTRKARHELVLSQAFPRTEEYVPVTRLVVARLAAKDNDLFGELFGEEIEAFRGFPSLEFVQSDGSDCHGSTGAEQDQRRRSKCSLSSGGDRRGRRCVQDKVQLITV